MGDGVMEDFEKILTDKGYKQFKYSPFNEFFAAACYQTSKKNDKGNRDYFITWRKWDLSKYTSERHPDLDRPRFEAETQLITKDKNVINITFLDGWKPDKVEEFMKKLFETGWFQSYDEEE